MMAHLTDIVERQGWNNRFYTLKHCIWLIKEQVNTQYQLINGKWEYREGMKTPSKTYLCIKADNPFSLKSDQNLSSSYNITTESYI